jgi:hypothetical protein
MSARLPKISKQGSTYTVTIAPEASISWRFELDRHGTKCIVQINAPSLTTWGTVDEATDRLTFPCKAVQ